MSAQENAGAGDEVAAVPARSELVVRIAAAAVLVPAALLAVWLGSWFFALFAALCGVLIVHEFFRMAVGRNEMLPVSVAASAVVLAALAALAMSAAVAMMILAVGAAICFVLAQRDGRGGYAAAGVLYAGLPVAALTVLRRDEVYGLVAVLLLLCVVWATDTGAYAAGRSIGGPKLWPRISPKKTWSGLIGGIACAAIVGWVFARFVEGADAPALALLAAALALVSQGGDLLESSLKRRFAVKDSGTLIPGHGGAMDRLDGVIAASLLAATIGLMRGSDMAAGAGLLIW